MYKKCVQFLGNVFNAIFMFYLILAHICQPPGGVTTTFALL